MRPRKTGERHYAVAVRDGAALFLWLDICRGPHGDVYANIPRPGEPKWEPHASKHASGQYHQKSFGHKALIRHGQKVDASFCGVENVVVIPIANDEPRRLNVPYQTTDFLDMMEISSGNLRPEHYATFIQVDITEANPVTINVAGTARQTARFQDAVPWIVVTLYEA